MGVKDYDLNPDNNTQINGINIAEGCPPSGINNAIRQVMADVKEDSDAQNTAIEALKKKAETAASAENLGPVKIGDGLSMGEDGTLSVPLATGEVAGRVLASTTATANAVPQAGADGKLDKSWRERKPGEYIYSHADEVEGALRCDGSAPSRVTYADLFAVIGTTFGAGDGKTTFNLPDARGKVLEGATGEPGQILQPGLPELEGTARLGNSTIGVYLKEPTGVFTLGNSYNSGVVAATNVEQNAKLQLRASLCNAIYGASDTVQMAAITTNVFIVY